MPADHEIVTYIYFDPTTYRDRYQEDLRALIEAKMKGLTVKPREIAAPPPVIDFMAALKRSLAREASGSKHTAAAPKKGEQDGTRSAPAGSLAAGPGGPETESAARYRARHCYSKATQAGLMPSSGASRMDSAINLSAAGNCGLSPRRLVTTRSAVGRYKPRLCAPEPDIIGLDSG